MKIAIAGWQHETNTFSPRATTIDHFKQADSWPALSLGDELLSRFNHANIPVSGFIERSLELGYELKPLLWCSAVPAGKVTMKTFDSLLAMMLKRLDDCGDIDAIYLDLHGAMVAEQYDDAEGFILQSIRSRLKKNIPIVVSLDLHANVSELMIEQSDVMIAYQTYPHIDMAVTGTKLADHVATALGYYKRSKTFSFIAPVTSQCTLIQPALGIYHKLQQLELKHNVVLSFTQGFALSDTSFSRPCLFGYGEDPVLLNTCIEQLARYINDVKKSFVSQLYSPQEAIKKLKQRVDLVSSPYIFADTQDNPGCGGEGNTTGILLELIKQKVKQAVVAMLFAPSVAESAHTEGVGGVISIQLCDQQQLFKAEVLALGDGDIVGEGPFYQGVQMQIGKMALLSIDDVQVMVASSNVQAADRAIFKHLDVEIDTKRIIVLKSSVHFRADFQSLAEEILLIESPGLNTARLNQLHYTKLDASIELL